MCLCIFGYECPQIASGWGGAGEGEGWRESDEGALLSAHFLMPSSLWGNKPQGMKYRPLAQLGQSCTLCATYWTVSITWLIALFSPFVNISSLFSCLALWNTKGNVSPDKLGIMIFWAGQLLVRAIQAQGAWNPKSFLSPFVWFSSALFFPASATTSGLPILCSVFSQHLLPFLTTGRSQICRKQVMAFTYPKTSSYKCQDAHSKGSRENKWKQIPFFGDISQL